MSYACNKRVREKLKKVIVAIIKFIKVFITMIFVKNKPICMEENKLILKCIKKKLMIMHSKLYEHN
jgi:hypothetical protein